MWTAERVTGSAPSMVSVAGSVIRRNRNSQFANRLRHAGRAFFRPDLGRAVSPSISTSIWPWGAPPLTAANSFGCPAPGTRSCLARTSRSTRVERCWASNSSKQSASWSHTEITRVLPPTSRTARAMSVKPSSQRRVLRRVSSAPDRFLTGSKPSRAHPAEDLYRLPPASHACATPESSPRPDSGPPPAASGSPDGWQSVARTV